MNLIYHFWRDLYRESLVAMIGGIDSATFMSWAPDVGTMVGVPRIAGV
ncbi:MULTISPECIES: hypothetical protein [unclassified Burkholderia]|nr:MULTISPECIES: hypothetical protein [unclassified Burkholderia]